MSTFYGGEQLVDTDVLTGVTTGSTVSIFTCPIGHYTKVLVERLDTNSLMIIGGSVNNPASTTGNSILTDTTVSDGELGSIFAGLASIGSSNIRSPMPKMLINSGEQIFVGPNGTTNQKYRVTVETYKKP